MRGPGNSLVIAMITFVTLIFSMPSHAACAWVLWQKIEHTSKEKFWDDLFSNKKIGISDDWHVIRSFDDKEQCVKRIHAILNSITPGPKKRNPEIPSLEETVTVSFGETSGTVTSSVKLGEEHQVSTTEYLCLPDTIDPRGKK